MNADGSHMQIEKGSRWFGMPDREKTIRELDRITSVLFDSLALLKEKEPDASKYQYKYDHTDCLWYRDSRSKCPVTCSQYRDGWNDAMDFVFKNGAGYSPYKRR